MQCYVHNETEAMGTCVSCGKFICENCNTEVNKKNHCKSCIGEILNAKEEKKSTTNSRVRIKKSKISAGILALFLGGMGIHKFYLNQIGFGILYLLFCWTFIPGFIALIEGIIYLCMDEDKFSDKYDIFR